MKTGYEGTERRKGERRSGKERRINPPGAYSGPERRKGERRSGRDRRKNT